MSPRTTHHRTSAFGKWFESLATGGTSRNFRSRRTRGSRHSRTVDVEQLELRQLLTSLTFDSVNLLPAGAGVDDVTADANGNSYITGRFGGTVDFAPTTQFPGDADVLTARGSNDIFLAKFDSNNQLLWVNRFGGDSTVSGYDQASAIEVDASGNVWLTGNFAENADFGNTALTSVGNRDIFLTRVNATGTVEWAVGFGGEGYDIPVTGFAVDGNGNATVGGRTTGVTPMARYLRQYDSSGVLNWNLDDVTSGDKASILQIDSDSNGNVFVAGGFLGNVDFDLSGNSDRIQGAGELENAFRNGYVSQYSVYGTYGWTTAIIPGDGNGVEVEFATLTAIAVDDLDEVTLIGTYHDGSVSAFGSGNTLLQTVAPFVADQHGYFVKLAANGDVQTSRNYWSVVDAPPISDIIATPDGYAALGRVANSKSFSPGPGVYVDGFGTLPGFDGSRVFATVLMELDSTGQVITAGTIGGVVTSSSLLSSTTPSGLHRTPTGKLIVAGATPTSSGVEVDYDPNPNATSDVKTPAGFVVQLSEINPGDSIVLFKDGFEYENWSTMSGLWIQDSQNDWFRSTQRSTTGTWSAEVDGSATNATLTTANVIDLSGMASATLTFDWLIESGFDAGEYLSLDISTNGGSSWIQDVRRLNGNASVENVWHSETVDLSSYMSSQLKVRFRSKVSASDEDANVDNVRIVGVATGPNTPPVADVGGPYFMNEGSIITLDGAGSSDSDGTIVDYAWDFDGDGQFDDATGVSPAFTRTISGTHTVGLQVTDNRGDTATMSAVITVLNVAPTANAGADKNGTVGAPISLTGAASTDPGNDIVSFAWDLDNDGQYDDASGVLASFSSSVAGVFLAGLQVTDADGAVSYDSATITFTAAAMTRFYVVDDASTNMTYEYAADGSSIENYAISSGNSAPRGAASNAAGTTVWVADKNRKVYVYDTAGGLQGSWSAGTLSTRAQVEGLATDGTDVWIVDNRNDTVYRYSNAAGRLSGSQNAVSSFFLNSGNTNPKGIVTDGTSLWVVNDGSSDKVFKYSLSGTLLGSWTIDSGNQTPTGLTIDPSNGSQSIWIVDSGTDRVYEYVGARSRVSGSQAAAATFALAAGNSNPQGIADPPPVTSSNSPPRLADVKIASATAIASQRSLSTNTKVRLFDNQFVPVIDGAILEAHQLSTNSLDNGPVTASQAKSESQTPAMSSLDDLFSHMDSLLDEEWSESVLASQVGGLLKENL